MKESNWSFYRIFFVAISAAIVLLGIFTDNSRAIQLCIGGLVVFSLVILDIGAPKIVKLSNDNPKVKTLRFINRICLSIIILILIFTGLKPFNLNISERNADLLTAGGIALFIMIFGNLAPKIPFNRFVGLRLPWTVRDEDTWRLAHKISGFLSFPVAIVMFILSIFINNDVIIPIAIVTWVAIPGLYSGWFFYNKFKNI